MAESVQRKLGRQLYPELQWLEERADRVAVFRRAQRRLFASPWGWAVAGPLTIGLVVGVHHGRLWALGHTPLPSWLIMVVAAAVLLGYVYYASTFIFVHPMRRHIRALLCARGIPLCHSCGYHLRGLSDARCPECGAAHLSS